MRDVLKSVLASLSTESTPTAWGRMLGRIVVVHGYCSSLKCGPQAGVFVIVICFVSRC